VNFLRIHNWERWQTYRKDRAPPWIKIHRSLLLNVEWQTLNDAEKGQLVSVWMLAAERNGYIPDDAKLVQRLCNLCLEPDLERFLSLQFLEKITKRRQRASKKHVALEERRGEADTEERREEARARTRGDPVVDLPEWIAADDWTAWQDHRREIRKPLTPSQAAAQIRKLTAYRDDGHAPADVIQNSIAGGWQGLFPPDKRRANGNGYETPHDRIKRLNRTDGDDPFAEHDARAAGGGDAAPVGSHGRGVRS
jgi:hypothetical protein